MLKLGVVVWIYFAVHAIWGDRAFAAEPVIRSVELKTFDGDVGRIGSLYNSTWFVVGKCCPVGQVFHESDDEEANSTDNSCRDPLPNEKFEYSPIFSPFNESGMLVPGEPHPQFVAVVGNPCQHGRFALEPEIESKDEFHLLGNGSIYVPLGYPIMMAPGLDYCMEFVPGRNLTVLVCLQPELKIVTADTRLAFYAVGLLTSVPFLLATILAYSVTHQLRDLYGMALCCYSGCQAVAFLSLAILQLGGHLLDENGCDGIAFVIQFSFIACFFWLNVMTVETWQLVRQYGVVGSAIRNGRPNSGQSFLYYSLWGWGLPAILIIVSLVRNLQPIIPWTYVKRSGNELPNCWFGLDKPGLPYFYAPVGILVLANVILFTITGVKIARTQRDLDLRRMARNQESDREDRRVFRELRLTFIVTLVLFIIMGINWAMELVSVLTDSDLLAWSVFDLVNALQGVLVFGLFVLRKPARTLVWRRIQKLTGSKSSDSDNERTTETMLLPMTNNTTVLPSRTLNQ